MREPLGDVGPEKILQLGLGFWGSKTLLSAVEIGVFSELAKGAASGEALSSRLGLHARSARDFLDALVALGMLRRDDAGIYSNTPESDRFLDKAKPSYVGGILAMANARLFGFWNSLTDALRTGKPQNEAKHGGGLFETLYADPERLRQFLASMTGLSLGAAHAIAAKFPWKDYQSFVDVGCAQGALPVQVALAHPHLKGGGFDLPSVQPTFDAYVQSFELSSRVKFHPGDFMKDPLPKSDVLVMGHILHDWDLEQKRMLIRKAYDALPEGGAFIVFETIIDDERRTNAFGLLMSLNMLIETPGGFDFSGADCRGWLEEAGFRRSRVEHLTGPDSMVIGIK